ncbi:MAG: ERF family protein [Acholeplasmataceae bacterium]
MDCERVESQSDSIASLAAALVKAQAVMQPAAKTSENPFLRSRYADLSSVWDAIRTPLTDNGLAVVQACIPSDGTIVRLRTVLLHDSGEYISSEIAMVPKDTLPQSMGSCLTYARRYALCAMVGVSTEDDDGNASARERKVATHAPPAADLTPLAALIAEHGITDEQQQAWCEYFKVANLGGLTQDQVDAIVRKIHISVKGA